MTEAFVSGSALPDWRAREQVLTELLASVPGHVPELSPRPGYPARGWLELMALQLDVLRRGVDGLPDNARLRFLERFGASQLPSQSARAPLMFTLLETTTADVTLPGRSQVAARIAAPAPSVLAKEQAANPSAPVYFTETTVTLTHGSLGMVYSVDPASDTYADHTSSVATGFTLFRPAAPMPHRLYLGHSTLLRLAGTAEVQLSFDFSSLGLSAVSARRPILLDWSYLSKDGWLPLAVAADSTMRFTQDGLIRLTKDCGPDAASGQIAGVESYWIRAEVSARRPTAGITGIVSPTELAI